MNDDEAFAASIRPDSVFGALGSSDHFDDEVEEFGEMAEGWDGSEPEEVAMPEQGDGSMYSSMGEDAPMQSAAPVVTNSGSSLSAGFGLLWIVGAGLLGWHFGRVKGAAGGALAAAGTRNLYRAQRDMRSPSGDAKASAIRPGLIGLVGVGLGGYLLYEATK